MKKDAFFLFSSAQAVTAAAESTNVYDASAARDIMTGEDLEIVTTVTTALTDGSSDSTVLVTLQNSSDNITFTDVQTLFRIAALAPVTTSQATTYKAKLAPYSGTDKRYWRVYYTPENGNLTTGSFTTELTTTAPAWKAKPKGYTITNTGMFS